MKQNCKELDLLIHNVVESFEDLRKFVNGFAASRARIQAVLDERFQKIVDDLSSLAAKSTEIQRATVPGSHNQSAGNRSNESTNSNVNNVTVAASTSVSHKPVRDKDQAFSQPQKQTTSTLRNRTNHPVQGLITNQLSRQLSQPWFDPFGLMWLPKSNAPDIAKSAVAESVMVMSSYSRSGAFSSPAIDVAVFANQLHLRALQRGYRIITGANTPRSLLNQTFGHCIPEKSRSHIVHRVEYLMQCLSETCGNAVQSLDKPQYKSFAGRGPQDTTETDPWTRKDPSGAVVRYIGATDVSAYVLSRGYDVGNYAPDMAGSERQESQSLSLGLERSLRSRDVSELVDGKIDLQTGLVQATTLTWVTALSLLSIVLNHGPAFRRSDVDELLNTLSMSSH